jgi:hypothetical protein
VSSGPTGLIAWIRDKLKSLTGEESTAWRNTGKDVARFMAWDVDEKVHAERLGRQGIDSDAEGPRTPEHMGASSLEGIYPPPRLIDRSIPGERYYIQDTASPRFIAHGSVSRHGELSIDLRTQLEDGQRSTLLSGAEHFQAIVKFFEGEFTSIVSNWQYGTNLAHVNELTARGLSLEAAAASTWSGKQAEKVGFQMLRILNSRGDPGRYTSVKVEFTQ